MKYLRFILLASIGCIAQTTYGQTDEEIRNHTIISVDRAGCGFWANSSNVLNEIESLLFDYRDASVSEPLYVEGDLISIMGFRADNFTGGMSDYASLSVIDGREMSYISESLQSISEILSTNWREIVAPHSSGSNAFSLVSVAKPYSLAAAQSRGELTNRTFLIMITDHHYNGLDFYDEVVAFSQFQSGSVNQEEIFKLCHQVEQEYFIKHLETRKIFLNSTYYNPNGYVELYEFLPLQQHISLVSILDYPPQIVAKRISGGRYHYDLNIGKRDSDRYRVKRVDITNWDSSALRQRSWESYSEDKPISYEFTGARGERPDSLKIRAWVNLIDGFYDATVLSPSDAASVYLGREGLNISIPIVYEADARIILNAFALPDWLVGDNLENGGQYRTANIINIILIILGIIILAILRKKYSTYRLTKENTTIEHY